MFHQFGFLTINISCLST